MGSQEINNPSESAVQRRAIQHVLRDLNALQSMIERDLLESDTRRIGAEQELIFVDKSFCPAPVATGVIERIGDPRVVPELAEFNIEFNCDPIVVGSGCLGKMHHALKDGFERICEAAAVDRATPLLTGICPTIDLSHISRQSIAPNARYATLDEMLHRLRGTDYELRIEGADELIVRHPSVMLESVNTSFQVHYQTTPEEFAAAYNTALAVAAPVLAASVNSPVLFGKRLWRETRIAVFQQVVDTRSGGLGHREFLARVRFGEKWVLNSVLEIFQADVARFRQLVAADERDVEDPFVTLEAGGIPKLKALQVFNSAVYRWVRPCYGMTNGKPHLRIENRVLPSGPTIEDEVANAAFWIGLMAEGPHAWAEVSQRLDFADVRSNFLAAAQHGLACHISWLGGNDLPIRELIAEEFLPAARLGLARLGIDVEESDTYLGIIEERVRTGRTGARWVLDSVARLRGQGTRAQRLECLTQAMVNNQRSGSPVHKWDLVEQASEHGSPSSFTTVSQCMSTDLFTVAEDECIDLVASIMDWERLRHILVENEDHRLVGIVSYRVLLRLLVHREDTMKGEVLARHVMIKDPVTVTPETPSIDAIKLMCEKKVSCLPVVEGGRLVGVVSERDYTTIAKQLLERALLEDSEK